MTRRAGQNSDATLWQQAMRDVKPLVPRSQLVAGTRAAYRRVAGRFAPSVAMPKKRIALNRGTEIDLANAERPKRRQRKIEARLDLHGMTQKEAHRALLDFIRAARGAGKRCVLVITGHGRLGTGVLKAAVPRWLDEDEFRPHLVAIALAGPQDGGAGALYVLLRRNAKAPDR